MSKTINVNNLSPTDRKALLKQLAAEEKKERQSKQKQFDGYKEEVTKTVDNLFFPACERK